MSETNNVKRSLVQARVSPDERKKIEDLFRQTTCRKLSEYVRKVLLTKPVTIRHRNQSLDDLMGELIKLRGELNAIGNNYNQVVRRLYTLQQQAEVAEWLSLHQSVYQVMAGKVEEIKSTIAQIDNQWLQ